MNPDQTFTLSFTGYESDNHMLDFYDASQALIGFQRSLALTVHLALNSEIIVQAPSLKGAQILVSPIEEGSWKVKAGIFAAAYGLLSLPQNTIVGHLMYSIYDYAVSEIAGFHVDYNKSLGQLAEEHALKEAGLRVPSESQVDSLVEKIEPAVREMHRPIYKSKTASKATIKTKQDDYTNQTSQPLSYSTYEFIKQSVISEGTESLSGKVSSYNINTYKGRVYIPRFNRPISFVLDHDCRNSEAIKTIMWSMSENSLRNSNTGTIYLVAYAIRSKNGYLKEILVTGVSNLPFSDDFIVMIDE